MSYQPYPSGGQPVESVRPPAPVPVLNAVKLMYVGAAVSTISLIISLVDIGGSKAAIRKARPSLTTAQVNQLNTFIITLAVVSGVEMFVQQGARQFEIWTGKPAPEAEMLRVAELALRKRA